jgi:hypothetical protein
MVKAGEQADVTQPFRKESRALSQGRRQHSAVFWWRQLGIWMSSSAISGVESSWSCSRRRDRRDNRGL